MYNTIDIKVVWKKKWAWNQNNGKQMILVSMDTHMYKQCILNCEILKKRVAVCQLVAVELRGVTVHFFLKNIFRISIQIMSQRWKKN
jgi:hypothetical protein